MSCKGFLFIFGNRLQIPKHFAAGIRAPRTGDLGAKFAGCAGLWGISNRYTVWLGFGRKNPTCVSRRICLKSSNWEFQCTGLRQNGSGV